MTTKNKIVLAVLSVILILGIAAAVVTSGVIPVDSGEKLEDSITHSFKTDYPLVQTQDKNIFYEPYPDGTIKFYKADGTEVKSDEIKTVSAKIDISYQKVPVKIYYLKTESGTVGYGLFTTEQDTDVKLFSYVFVRLMKTPAAFKKAAGTDYILLADTDAKDAYKTDKTYSEMYSFNLSSGKAELVISQRDRTVQDDGTVNTGWTIFTDSSINCAAKNDLFASTRTHDSRAEEKQFCIMNIANSTSMKKAEAAKIQDSPSYEIREKDGAWYCFVSKDGGFDLIKNGDKKKPVKSFEGSFSDYDVSGDWIFSKTACKFTNIYTGETKTVKSFDTTGFADFTANADGTKFAVFINGKETQLIVLCDTQSNTQKILSNDNFDSGIGNFCFTGESEVMFTNYDESKLAENIIIKF